MLLPSLNKFGFRIRTRQGSVVENLVIQGKDADDAERGIDRRSHQRSPFRAGRLPSSVPRRLKGYSPLCSPWTGGLRLDSKQQPHIAYLPYGDGQLKYAHWNGTAWEKKNVQINAKVIDYYTSIAVDAKDYPRISFYEYWGTGEDYSLHLRNVAWNGQYWEVGTVDATPRNDFEWLKQRTSVKMQ